MDSRPPSLIDPRPGFGLAIAPSLALALLGLPRAVLHDLGVIGEWSAATWLLAVVPPICWVAAVVSTRTPRPLMSLARVGFLYGVILAITHQVLWDKALDGDVPELGGISSGSAELIMRVAAIPSSVLTGLTVGLVSGAVAWLILERKPRRRASGRAKAEHAP